MNFFTQIEPVPSGILLNTQSRITALGSCFAEVIGQQLSDYKWPVDSNTMGVLFHPLAIHDLMHRALTLDMFNHSDLSEFNGRYYILALHGQYSGPDVQALLDRVNADLKRLHSSLTNASHILITLGTAWAYEFLANHQIVGNCHKLPGTLFEKRLLTIDQIQDAVSEIIECSTRYNSEVQLIFSVSPVRHIKDGLLLNSLGKAHLISGLHAALENQVTTQSPAKYFPAYELMMDQLRDYRFYKSDLIHPNDQGVQVVWEYFKDGWIEPKLELYLSEIRGIQKGLAHRPTWPDSPEYIEFKNQLKQRILEFEQQYPHISFDDQIDEL